MSAVARKALERLLTPKKNKGPSMQGGSSDGPRFRAPESNLREFNVWNPHSPEATFYDRHNSVQRDESQNPPVPKRPINPRYSDWIDELSGRTTRRNLENAGKWSSGSKGRNNPRRKHQDDRPAERTGGRPTNTPPYVPHIPVIVPDRILDIPDGDPPDWPIEPELDIPVEFDVPEEPDDGEEDRETEEETWPSCEELPESMRAVFGYPRDCRPNGGAVKVSVEKSRSRTGKGTQKARTRRRR